MNCRYVVVVALCQGLNLNLACDAEEVKVWIGNETCRVNSIDLTTLYCTPPVVQPPYLGADGLLDPNSLPLVKVNLYAIS